MCRPVEDRRILGFRTRLIQQIKQTKTTTTASMKRDLAFDVIYLYILILLSYHEKQEQE